ncbi:MAG: flagellar basal body rod protein FlgC [Erythrobacter sp.]|nr:flagellar basal body rod protein FlgC [Erythrobacter sp.]
MSAPVSLFDVVQRGMSAQMVRMNAAASNLANAGSVASSEGEAYRPLRPVFQQELDSATGLSSVRVAEVRQSDVAAVRRHDPDHPLADANGDVWESGVDENTEMVEIMESARQYQNLVEAMNTAKQLMLDTIRSK